MQERHIRKFAFLFLILTVSSLVYKYQFAAQSMITQIMPAVFILLCLIWSLPVIYVAISRRQFLLSSSSLSVGVGLYQLDVLWSQWPVFAVSAALLLLVLGISNLVYGKTVTEHTCKTS